MFKRGEAAPEIKLLAAQGRLALRAHEQLGILMLLAADADAEIGSTADATLKQIPDAALRSFLARVSEPALASWAADIAPEVAARAGGPSWARSARSARPRPPRSMSNCS